VDFNEEIFFFLLLPPIIFESGFSLETKSFFRNFDGICALAFGGTLISTVVVGVFVWLAGALGLVTAISITHALVFGALVSATDPVTVLAVFQELGVNPDLFALVFGESVLNDAVAIVLYRTMLNFANKGASAASVVGVFESVGFFLFVFLGSTATGAAFAVLAAAFFRAVKGSVVLENNAHVETSLVMIAPYCAYAAAEFLQLSGIVAILFCGVVMAHYARPNLSTAARRDSAMIFKTLATLAETFVFLYMGVSLFLEDQAWSTVPFAVAALCACLLGRALNVYPMTRATNAWRARERFKVPANHQNALFVSGLRGAVAFALASSAVRDLGEPSGRVIRTATLMLVIFTVLVVGGACHSLVDWLELRAPSAWLRVDDDEGERRVEVEGDAETGAGGDAREGGDALGMRARLNASGHRSASPDCAAAPEFVVADFADGMAKLGAHLGEVRNTENLDLRGKMRAAAAAVGAVATVTTFEDIDKRYIKPYLAPDTPATPPRSGKDDDAEAPRGGGESFAIAPPPASPAPARSGGHPADAARAAGGDDDGEMTPVKFDT
jgi:sodium/hydrogen exchanger 8